MADAHVPRAPLEIIDPDWYGKHGPPHEAWTRLRREAPVAYCEPPGMLPFWAIVRHDDIVRISRDPEYFQNAPRLAVFPEEQFATDNFPAAPSAQHGPARPSSLPSPAFRRTSHRGQWRPSAARSSAWSMKYSTASSDEPRSTSSPTSRQ